MSLIEIQLQTPIVNGDERITLLYRNLETNPLTAADLEVVDQASGDMGKAIHLIAQIFNLTPGMVRRMSAQDFKATNQAIQPFLS